MEGGHAKKNPPQAAQAYLSELRIEGSDAVGFSEPCPCCGNRKRRCLNPPAAARKKLLVFESASSPPPPTSSLLRRSESSPLPSSASPSVPLRRAESFPLPSSNSPSAPLARSLDRPFSISPSHPIFPYPLESAAGIIRSPQPGPSFSCLCSDPIPPKSPPSSWKKEPAADPPSDRRLEMSSSSANPSLAHDKAVSSAAEETKMEGASASVAAAEEESGVSEGRAREEVRVSVSCRCGVVREVVLHQ